MNLGLPELLVILLFALLIAGPDRLPKIGQTLGKAIRQFRDAQSKVNETLKKEGLDPQSVQEMSKNPFLALERLDAQNTPGAQGVQGVQSTQSTQSVQSIQGVEGVKEVKGGSVAKDARAAPDAHAEQDLRDVQGASPADAADAAAQDVAQVAAQDAASDPKGGGQGR